MHRLVRCASCSFVRLDDPPNANEIAEHYGSDYDDLISAGGSAEAEDYWRDPRGLLLRYKKGGELLDLGCSSGSFISSLGPNWTCRGVEISPDIAAAAQQKTGADVFVGNVLDAPFAPASFDAVTCFHVLEHLYEPDEVLKRVYQWLKPGGVFIIFVPNIDSGAARLFGSYWYALELPRHLYHFSPVTLYQLAKHAGFEDTSITTHREPFIELSSRYINDEILRKLGFSRPPTSDAKPLNLFWKVVRRLIRWTVLPLVNLIVAAAGPGEIIHAVLEKKKPGTL